MKAIFWFLIGCGFWTAVAPLFAAGTGTEPRTPARMQRQMIDSARAEHQRLEAAGLLYRDHDLAVYLNDVAGRLIAAAGHSGEKARIQVIRDPYLKAYALPDGFCYVSTGILARVENEAQLAALLGHEIAHVLNRHALDGIRHLHRETPGNPSVSYPAGYRLQAEIEADRDSFQMIVSAGYDPREIIRLYEHLQEELALEMARESRFDRTHPRLSRRIEMFREMIAVPSDRRYRGSVPVDRFQQTMLPVMPDNAEMDIGIGRFAQARRTLLRYLQWVPMDARAHFLMGEIHRQQDASDEVRLAKACYQRAIELDADFAAPYRALGLICYKAGETAAARHYLKASLALAPDSVDNAYIRHYLNRLGN